MALRILCCGVGNVIEQFKTIGRLCKECSVYREG